MKNSLKFTLLLAGLIMLAVPVIRAGEPAAPPSDKPDRSEHRGPGAMMEHAVKELGLTADQEAKWKEIRQREKTALDAIRSDSTLSRDDRDRKSTRLNSSHQIISYAVFCLKKK